MASPVDKTSYASSTHDSQKITVTRTYLLRLLLVQWGICLFILVLGTYWTLASPTATFSNAFESFAFVIALLVFYTGGLLVTQRYDPIGLLIFAWFGVIIFVGVFLFVVYIILAILAVGTAFGNATDAYQVTLFLGLVFAVVALIIIMSIRYAFKLAKSIRAQEYLPV